MMSGAIVNSILNMPVGKNGLQTFARRCA